MIPLVVKGFIYFGVVYLVLVTIGNLFERK